MKKLIALLSALALLAAACGSGSDASDDGETSPTTAAATGDDGETTTTEPAPAAEAGSGGNITLLQWQAPSQANGLLSNGTKDLMAASLVLEPLLDINPDGTLEPVLATEVPTVDNGGISEDLTTITYNLRDDVLWSDGSPFTADDAVFTWEYCIDEATGCAADVFQTVSTVVADSPTSLTITFNEPSPYPYNPYVGFNGVIIQRAQFADCVGAAAVGCSDENFGPNGTGPYVVTELRPEDTVTYEMNPNYRGIPDGKPFFGTVEIKGGGDAEAAARSVLEVGEADYAWNLQVAPEILNPMEAAGLGRVVSAFTANVEHINLNQTDPFDATPSVGETNQFFFEDPDLHLALSLAINRDELVTVGYGASGRPTCNIWPVGDQSTSLDECLTQDTERANQILDDAGYVDTDGDGIREKNGVNLEWDYVTSTNAVRQSNQELIAAHWDAIGVKANMKNEDASLFFDGTCASDACIWKFFNDIEMFTNGATNPDPQAYLIGYTQDQLPTADAWANGNIPRLMSDEYDAIWAELGATADPAARQDLANQLNDIVSSSAIIPLIHRANVSAFSNEIQGTGELNGWSSEYYNIEDWFRSE